MGRGCVSVRRQAAGEQESDVTYYESRRRDELEDVRSRPELPPVVASSSRLQKERRQKKKKEEKKVNLERLASPASYAVNNDSLVLELLRQGSGCVLDGLALRRARGQLKAAGHLYRETGGERGSAWGQPVPRGGSPCWQTDPGARPSAT